MGIFYQSGFLLKTSFGFDFFLTMAFYTVDSFKMYSMHIFQIRTVTNDFTFHLLGNQKSVWLLQSDKRKTLKKYTYNSELFLSCD